MRLFPRAAGRRVATALALCGLVVGVTAVPFAQADDRSDDLKDRRATVRKQIEHAHQDLEESSRRFVKATQALGAARAELTDARSELDGVRIELAEARVRDLEMQDQLTQAETDLEFAELAVTAGTAAVGRQRDSVASLISTMYTEGDPDLLAVASLLDAESPADLIRSAQGRQVIVGVQTRTYADLSASEVSLQEQETEVAAARRAVAAKAKEAADHLLVMEDLEARTRTAKDDVVRLVGDRRVASVEALAAKKADRKKLAQRKLEDARLEKRLAELARQARQRALAKARRQGRDLASPSASDGFLFRPVPGAVTSSFGMRVHPIYGYYGLHDGTDFGVACGQPMHSAADGKVAQSYYSTSYGNRLVIDNGFQRGVGLATIYNHATSYTVGVGDQVTRGQVVGYVGSTGWSTGCHLHFTVMANGTPVDPMGWL